MDKDEHLDKVDANPKVHDVTVENEEEILRDLYGEPDAGGYYKGEEDR